MVLIYQGARFGKGKGEDEGQGARAMEGLVLGLGFGCELDAGWLLVAAPQKEQGPELLRSGPVVLPGSTYLIFR